VAGDEDFKMAAAQLRTRLQQFIGVAEAADADSWGADIFRRLLGYARAVLEDLVEVVGNGQVHAATLEHVSQLGAELDLQRWADVWPSHTEYTDAIADTVCAVEAFQALARARAAGGSAT
jgi:hypothetical protein